MRRRSTPMDAAVVNAECRRRKVQLATGSDRTRAHSVGSAGVGNHDVWSADSPLSARSRTGRLPAMATPACPRCGGTSSNLLAPGYHECTSQMLVNVVPPGAQGNPGPVPIYQMCGNRYKTGAAAVGAPQCACGMYAVGACRDCGEPLCGRHVNTRNDTVLCADHANAVDRARAQEKANRKDQQLQALHAWEADAVEALLAVPDRVERFLRAVVEIEHARTPDLNALLKGQPSNRAIADWLIAHAAPPLTNVLIYEQGLFGSKQRRYPGWTFSGGSVAIYNFPHGEKAPGAISVLTDGRIYYDRSFTPAENDRFNAEAIKRIYRCARVQPLGLPPRPRVG
jgi:hypothetical protein